MLQTEIGTRGRLEQLEQWNASAFDLAAPNANQFVRDSFQLATLVKPQPKLSVEAPVVLASAPVVQPQSPLDDTDPGAAVSAPQPELLHQASLKTMVPDRPSVRTAVLEVSPPPEKPVKAPVIPAPAPPPEKNAKRPAALTPATVARTSKSGAAQAATAKPKASSPAKSAEASPAKAVKLAEVDPLAPLPSKPQGKDSRGKK
jgi:hypothetical protein